jgi:hypothetical protein
MKNYRLGILIIAVVLTAALIGGGTLTSGNPETAAEEPPSSELLLENLKVSPDADFQGVSGGTAFADAGSRPTTGRRLHAKPLKLPAAPLMPTAVQPRSPPQHLNQTA